ncbi:uncharacterized protein CC84DRAFT_276381 [Paraphaeosphaeria sporulosa]|uniref:Uncharacterized protein n=1 Tax=Paraphaeosphaeria sporulosa TaxID=1460663 RepID=A0A177C1I0_9PLEO|nr:uncharacterized protein CC84DRAFT_276381 [Paraphaeosphaeria sporulosa]OAG01071.1 hypothetical protein CC84DRAFT_276381 [Paraphaeosphaeria sporulosa]
MCNKLPDAVHAVHISEAVHVGLHDSVISSRSIERAQNHYWNNFQTSLILTSCQSNKLLRSAQVFLESTGYKQPNSAISQSKVTLGESRRCYLAWVGSFSHIETQRHSPSELAQSRSQGLRTEIHFGKQAQRSVPRAKPYAAGLHDFQPALLSQSTEAQF